jgi:cytochrome P450
MKAISEALPFQRIFIYNGGVNNETVKFHAKSTRDQFNGRLDPSLLIEQKFHLIGIDKLIGDCKDPKIFNNAWYIINNIVSLSIANIFVGEEAASHEDLVDSFANLVFDFKTLLAIPPVLSFIHKKLHEFVITLPMRFGWNPITHHRKVVISRIRPVIEKRLKEKIILGNDYKPYHDLLEYYMNQPDFNINDLPYHVDNLFLMVFGSISSTSRVATNTLYALAGRPECMNELYEEALSIDKERNGSITMSDIKKMEKLDSFIKESHRHTNHLVDLPHYVTSESYTFYNGYTIPEGRMISMYFESSLKSKEAFGDDAEEFKPFRFVDTNSNATKVDRFFIAFGNGKHACPGRFFAINEIKLILHRLILKYNISTKSGKIEDKSVIGPITFPPRSALVFENKKIR